MMKTRIFKNKSSIWLSLVILMTLIIWINSMLSATVSSEQSGFITDLVQSFLQIFDINISYNALSSFIRTFAHFTEFFVLGIFWGYYLKHINHKLFLILAVILLTAIIDESIQLCSEGRAFQVFDISIDFFGGIFAFVFHKAINVYGDKNIQKKM